MKLSIAVSAVSLLLCGPLACRRQQSLRPPADADQPAIDFDARVYDFGVVNEGAPIRHVFHVLNKGAAALELSGTTTSCGCTAAILGIRAIPPGGSGTVDVTMDTHGERGQGARTITVTSNDPREPMATLRIKYDVEPLLQLDRWYVHLGTGPNSKTVEQLWLSGQSMEKAKLSFDVQGTDLVSVRSIEVGKPNHTRKGLQIELHAKNSKSPISGDGVVTIKTGLSQPSELRLRFGYTVD